MPAPFAALQQSVTSAVFASLANADATVGGVAQRVIFDNGYELGNVGLQGMSSTQPTLILPTNRP